MNNLLRNYSGSEFNAPALDPRTAVTTLRDDGEGRPTASGRVRIQWTEEKKTLLKLLAERAMIPSKNGYGDRLLQLWNQNCPGLPTTKTALMCQYQKDRKREAVTPAAFSEQSVTNSPDDNGRNLSSPDNGNLTESASTTSHLDLVTRESRLVATSEDQQSTVPVECSMECSIELESDLRRLFLQSYQKAMNVREGDLSNRKRLNLAKLRIDCNVIGFVDKLGRCFNKETRAFGSSIAWFMQLQKQSIK